MEIWTNADQRRSIDNVANSIRSNDDKRESNINQIENNKDIKPS